MSPSRENTMQFGLGISMRVAVVGILFGMASMVISTPIPCSDATRDLVLRGDLDPSACCSYGVCIGDVNVQGG